MYSKIQSILNNHLASISGLPPILWENTTLELDDIDTYLEVHLFPADDYYPFLGDNTVNINGIYQINVVTPKSIGWGQAAQYVDILRQNFYRGQVLTDGDLYIKIKQTNVANGINTTEGTYVVPVSVIYFAYYK